LDLRSVSAESLDVLAADAENIINSFDAGDSVICCEIVGERPACGLNPDSPLLQVCCDVLAESGIAFPKESACSTDAAVPISRGHQAICVGIADVVNAHRVDEYLNVRSFYTGFRQLFKLVMAVAHSL